MGESGDAKAVAQLPKTLVGSWSVVTIGPEAVQVRELVEAVGVYCDLVGDIVIVGRVLRDSRTDEDRAIHAIPVHLVQQLIHAPSCGRIRDLRVKRPDRPGMCMSVNDHATASVLRGASNGGVQPDPPAPPGPKLTSATP